MTGVTIGYAGFWGAAVAHADTLTKKVQYSCSESGAGSASGGGFASETVSFTISWGFPQTVTAGSPLPTEPFTVLEQIPESTVQEMRDLDISSVKGNGTTKYREVSPGDTKTYTLPYTVPTTSLPASGPANIMAYGSIPSLTYPQPGTVQDTLGTVVFNETPLDSSGNAVYGTESLTCTPTSQNIVFDTFRIDPAPKPSAPAPVMTRPQPQPPRPTTRKPSPSPRRTSPSPRRSSSTSNAALSAPVPSPQGTDWDQIMIIGAAALASAGVGALGAWFALRNR